MTNKFSDDNAAKAREIAMRIADELDRAEKLHPHWPLDPIYAVAILTEEVGEAMREAIDLTFGTSSTDEKESDAAYDRLKTELVQCGAMVFRALIHLED